LTNSSQISTPSCYCIDDPNRIYVAWYMMLRRMIR